MYALIDQLLKRATMLQANAQKVDNYFPKEENTENSI